MFNCRWYERKPPETSKPFQRFMSRVEKSDRCWVWTGARDKWGYGRYSSGLVHRIAFFWFQGALDPHLTIDHLCRNRLCVNPAHLEQVTKAENNLRGISEPAINARKKACKRGHPFTPENTYLWGHGRICRECRRLRWKESRS